MDMAVSSRQLTDSERGFDMKENGSLDMVIKLGWFKLDDV